MHVKIISLLIATLSAGCMTGARFTVDDPIKTGEFNVAIMDFGETVRVGIRVIPLAGCFVTNETQAPLRLLSVEVCADDCRSNSERRDILLPKQSAFIEHCVEIPYKTGYGNAISARVLSEPIKGNVTKGVGTGVSRLTKEPR